MLCIHLNASFMNLTSYYSSQGQDATTLFGFSKLKDKQKLLFVYTKNIENPEELSNVWGSVVDFDQ